MTRRGDDALRLLMAVHGEGVKAVMAGRRREK
jgi:hypothetical protein